MSAGRPRAGTGADAAAVPPTAADALFVRAHTALDSPALVPELRLHLGWGVVELWEGVEVEAGRTGLEPPFWAFPWAGGQALARYLLDHPGVVAGRTVLDVATGSGLVAIAAARAGAASVRAADVDPLAAAAALVNAEVNGVRVDARTEDLLEGDGEGADVVLAGDVFYQRAMAERFTAFLVRAAARGATVLVGDPERRYLPRELLTEVLGYDVPVVEDLEGQQVKRTTVFALTAR